jgi:8-oxo-dGTP pyrophosphatase MutT (NUDIX family)
MTGASILPVAIHKNKLYFLFGRDTGDTPGFACFGGGMEKHETNVYKAALREGAEELTGFLGNAEQLETLVETNGGYFPITHQSNRGLYHAHVFRIPYDPLLPIFYKQNHDFLLKKMSRNHFSQNKHLFEKEEITWMTPKEMLKRKHEFRPFYRLIVEQIIATLPSIQEFLKTTPTPTFITGETSSHTNTKTPTKKNKTVKKRKIPHK